MAVAKLCTRTVLVLVLVLIKLCVKRADVSQRVVLHGNVFGEKGSNGLLGVLGDVWHGNVHVVGVSVGRVAAVLQPLMARL